MGQTELLLSPLDDVHRKAGAIFTEFAGYDMPLRYGSELDEHQAVRQAAGLFDLSHMGEIFVAGPEAGDAIDYALAGKPSAMEEGRARYNLMLNEQGGIVDDLIVYRLPNENEHPKYLVVANASNRKIVAAKITERASNFAATVQDDSEKYALIAVQGPHAQKILDSTVDFSLVDTTLDEVRYYRCDQAKYKDNSVLIARTGYTGEDGFELVILAEHACEIWYALLEAGKSYGLVPCGLACRDTLRLEAGMPLYGHELREDILPSQAGVGRVVAFSKPNDFVGRTALEQAVEPAQVLVGLTGEGRRAFRAGCTLHMSGTGADSEVVGEVVSGALSPTLGFPIAMAYVNTELAALDTVLDVNIRGKVLPATVVKLPFYSRKER